MEFSSFDIRNYRTVPVQEGYRAWVKTYEETVQDEMDIRLLEGLEAITWPRTKTVVDLACGTGRIGSWLKAKGVHDVDGVDFTPEMLAMAEKKGVYRNLYAEDVTRTSLRTASYDLAIQVLADEHLADLLPLYSEASRVTKPGGHFVIVGYHPYFLMQGIITHFHPDGGDALAIESYVHLASDHVKAARAVDWSLREMDEGIVDEAWLEKKPKWEQYRNRPVSFVMVWRKAI